MRVVRIYLLWHDERFVDVFASYSAAMREKHPGSCCRIEARDREDY